MNFKRYKSGLVFALAVGSFISCQKTFDEKTVQQQDFSNSAIVQMHVATVNALRNYLYIDANKLTGALMSTGSIFPTTGTGFMVNPCRKGIPGTGYFTNNHPGSAVIC